MSILSPADTDLAAIARYAAGMGVTQLRAVRDRILAEVWSIEAHFPERTPPDGPGQFQLERDRLTCARRRREVDYLDALLAGATVE